MGTGHLYSGARDKTVMAWELDESGHLEGTHHSPADAVLLPDWVNALTVRRGLAGAEGGMGVGVGAEVIVAGCKDAGIYAMQWEGGDVGEEGGGGGLVKTKALVVQKTFMGHNAPISSLSWSAEGLLLSGSWDETARGWDLETSECKWVLGGHENNVCVLGLGPGLILTGSTGLEVEGRLVGEQIRMWKGFPPKETRSLTDHTSGIRDLCGTDDDDKNGDETAGRGGLSSPSKSFCSGSNDGTVRAWSGDGDCRAVFTVPVAVLPGMKSGVPGTKNQIKTPFVCDVATGSADFRVRVFTPDPDRALQGEALKEAEKACGVGGGGSCGGEGGSGGGAGGDERLPPVSEMGVMVGGEDGQLSAFYDEVTGEAKVFRWIEAAISGGGVSSRWEPMGALRPPVRKVAFEGGLYDKVIPVEVDSASRGLLVFQLGVNNGDDPKNVAAAFCEKHSLGPEYLPQIEQFLFLTSLS
eukprot:jgi/Undpi1/2258/HiC_scaffold_13.g05644.m1